MEYFSTCKILNRCLINDYLKFSKFIRLPKVSKRFFYKTFFHVLRKYLKTFNLNFFKYKLFDMSSFIAIITFMELFISNLSKSAP